MVVTETTATMGASNQTKKRLHWMVEKQYLYHLTHHKLTLEVTSTVVMRVAGITVLMGFHCGCNGQTLRVTTQTRFTTRTSQQSADGR
jgi:hypothetical protein